MARDNGLPPREAQLFKSIVKHYETKQYKKGLKAADQVLKKFVDHGETLAMKGLILNCMDRKAEAYELVRKGVKMDIKSHVCWHVYGLLYRSDRDYLQAIKCYRGALRHDPDNNQILRDLSLLQVQMRDHAGFVSTRQHLLTLKPTNRNNWFTFAVAQHLRGQAAQALGIVEAYERTLEGAPENEYEHSEMLLYKNMLLEESGTLDKALEHLDANEKDIVDKLFVLEKRASLLLGLGRHADAEPLYRQLLKRNSEHYGYHAGLQACVLHAAAPVECWRGATVDAATEGQLKDLYAELQHQHPRSAVCRRLPLDFARDADYFRVAAKTCILPPLRKGVPSLFADLKPLYADAQKAAGIGAILEDWLSTLESSGCLRGESAQEMPSTIMWVRVLLAQHCDLMGDTRALSIIDAAIAHSPTLPDLYMVKARLYKHAGAPQDASDWMDTARRMDLADRYLNTKATRYMLRADQYDEAVKTIALFTKDGQSGDSNLFDMQCMWYELEVAACQRRLASTGRALKQYTAVDKHFSDILEDQFDFHTYCIRKMTLRAYINMLRMEDRLQGHAFFVAAARGMIECYIQLHDKPPTAEAAHEAEQLDELSASDRKKLESKRRKAEAKAKAEAEAAAKKEAPKDGGAGSGGGGKGKAGAKKEKPVDEDPDGAALVAAEAPLEKASTFLRTLQMHAPSDLRTHILACALCVRKKRYLLALRALRKARAIAPDDPEVHQGVIRFLHAISTADLSPTLTKVIDAQRDAIGAPPGQSLASLNEAYLQRVQSTSSSAAGVLAAAEVRVLLDSSQRAAALKLVSAIDVQTLPLPLAIAIHKSMTTTFADADAAKAFAQRALARFPLATYFTGTRAHPPPARPDAAAVDVN